MNTLSIIFDLAAIIIIAFCIWHGATRGFLKSLFRLISAFVSVFLAKSLFPATKVFMEKIFIKDIFHSIIASGLKNTAAATVTDITETSVRGLGLPEFVNKAFINSNYFTQVKNDGSATLTTAISNFLADYATTMLAYVVTFVLVSLAIFFILVLLNIFTMLPVIKSVDLCLGGFAGFVSACIILWIVLTAITIFLVNPDMNYIFNALDNSVIARMFYKLNPIISLVAGADGGF